MKFGTAQRPKQGEQVCGDRYLMVERERYSLVMVADGAGHGERAAEASSLAGAYVEAHPDQPLESILRGCGDRLANTRGAAVALFRVDRQTQEASFASVGNVEIRTQCRMKATAVASPGIVGRPVRKILTFVFPLSPGDRVAIFTDGISRRFRLETYKHLDVQKTAAKVLDEHSALHDDATCVVGEFFPRGTLVRACSSAVPETTKHAADVEVQVSIGADVICSGVAAQRLAAQVGFPRRAQYEVAVATQELASNIIKYASQGTLYLCARTEPRPHLEIQALDNGPGIEDIEGALRDSISQGTSWLELPTYHRRPRGLGIGLGTVNQLMDEVVVENRAGGGLRVACIKYLPQEGR